MVAIEAYYFEAVVVNSFHEHFKCNRIISGEGSPRGHGFKEVAVEHGGEVF